MIQVHYRLSEKQKLLEIQHKALERPHFLGSISKGQLLKNLIYNSWNEDHLTNNMALVSKNTISCCQESY